MSKGVKIDFGTSSGYTYDVYTSSSRTGTYTIYSSGFTGQYLTITGTPITGDVLYVKTTCPHCKDQIVKIKLVPDPISLTGSTVNGTCDNCGDPGEPECNGNITLYVCGGVRPYTYQWSGFTKSGKVLNATTKDLGRLEEGTYSVVVTDSYGITGTTGFTIQVDSCNPPTGLSAVPPDLPATPTPGPTSTPTPTPTNTYTPTPTINDGYTHLTVKSGTTVSNACDGVLVNVKYSGEFAYDTTILRLEDGTPVPDNYYYVVDGAYAGVVWIVDSLCMGCTHQAGNVHNLDICPSPTPVYILKTNLYVSLMDAETVCCSYDPGWYAAGTRFSANLYGGTGITTCIGMVEDTVGDIYNSPPVYGGNWWNDLSTSQQFWVKRKVGGDFFVRRFVRDGDNNSATAQEPAELCPIC